MAAIKDLIIGAGRGGLTLVQSLRASAIEIQMFERNESPWDRPQGDRLHLDRDAIDAVYEVLPPALRNVMGKLRVMRKERLRGRAIGCEDDQILYLTVRRGLLLGQAQLRGLRESNEFIHSGKLRVVSTCHAS